MTDLFQRVADFAAGNDLWRPGARLLVAVSGGPDSLCLLHLLHRLAPQQGLALHVAHLDHALRPESADDAAAVGAFADGLNLSCTIERRDPLPLGRAAGGVEAAARAARYAFLRDTALAIGATAVVTGHNADDQAETVLLRLLRGTGPSGLAAMRPALEWQAWRNIGLPASSPEATTGAGAPRLVRPLLAATRAEIETYCAEHALAPLHDSSNQSPAFLRNRVRQQLLPMLRTYNPRIITALGRTARICADEDALLAQMLEQAWPELEQPHASGIALDRAAFGQLHAALRRRALLRAYARVAGGHALGADHLDRMQNLAARRRGRLQLPGQVWMELSADTIVIRSKRKDDEA